MSNWSDDWKVSEFNKNTEKAIMMSSHNDLSKILKNAIDDTDSLAKEWNKEKVIRDNQIAYEQIDNHNWSIWGLIGFTLLIFSVVTFILCYLCRQHKTQY